MTYSSGSTIIDDDYNIFATGTASGTPNHSVANVNTVWGSGQNATDKGWGQSTTVSPVSAGTTISATQWATLLNRITSAANHQGSTITAITNPVTGDTISAYAALSANITTIFNNRNNAVASGSSSATNTDRTTSWGTSVTFTQSLQFSSVNTIRYFFNAGGRVAMTYSRTGGSSTDANTAITNLLTACGTITFTTGTSTQTIAGGSFTGTTKTGGSGSPTISTGTGWYDLTTVNQQVFTQSATSYYGYEGNSLTIDIRAPTSSKLEITTVIAKSGGLTTIDGTLRATMTVIPPSTTYISDTWGTPTAAGSQTGS